MILSVRSKKKRNGVKIKKRKLGIRKMNKNLKQK
jgi:hypothetical protein